MSAQPNSGVRIFPPAIHLVSVALGFLIQWVIPLRTYGMRIPGVVLLFISVALMAWSARMMARAGTTPNPTKPTTALLTRGPFGFSRNPMYLAWELVIVGVGLAANAPWVVVMALPAAFLTRRLVIDKEERYLDATFGSEYRDYKSRVRRWA